MDVGPWICSPIVLGYSVNNNWCWVNTGVSYLLKVKQKCVSFSVSAALAIEMMLTDVVFKLLCVFYGLSVYLTPWTHVLAWLQKSPELVFCCANFQAVAEGSAELVQNSRFLAQKQGRAGQASALGRSVLKTKTDWRSESPSCWWLCACLPAWTWTRTCYFLFSDPQQPLPPPPSTGSVHYLTITDFQPPSEMF